MTDDGDPDRILEAADEAISAQTAEQAIEAEAAADVEAAVPADAAPDAGGGLKALLQPSPDRPEDHADSEWAHTINGWLDKITGDPGDASSKNVGESIALCIEQAWGAARWPAILYPVKALVEWCIGLVRRDGDGSTSTDDGGDGGGYEGGDAISPEDVRDAREGRG